MIRIINNLICVCHGHPKDVNIKGDQPIGTPIKCFSIKKLGIQKALEQARDFHKELEKIKKENK